MRMHALINLAFRIIRESRKHLGLESSFTLAWFRVLPCLSQHLPTLPAYMPFTFKMVQNVFIKRCFVTQF